MDTAQTSQFYTGLVAELYEPLISLPSKADHYVPFLELAGGPALELGCGSGIPMLDLLQRGFEVEGLDSSADMLERCRRKARTRGLEPVLHHQTMESMALPRRYRAIYLAGPTFTLLPGDSEALCVLQRIHDQLEPEGRLLLPLHVPQEDACLAAVGRPREALGEDGSRVRVTVTAMQFDAQARSLRMRLRYEADRPDGAQEVVERDQASHWWAPGSFLELLREAGFEEARALDRAGAPAKPDSRAFACHAQRLPG